MGGMEENTVAAKGQMRNTDTLRCYGNPAAKHRILIVGNSITRHGPLPSIGWVHDWGMAASAEDKDYVHLFLQKLTERKEDFYLCVKQAADWEVALNEGNPDLSKYEEIRAFGADTVIFRLAENIRGDIDPLVLRNALREFLNFLNPRGGRVVLTTPFWAHATAEAEIRRLAQARGYALADLTPLGERADMKAYGLFKNGGVCAHPGDLGMAAIAEEIANAYFAR